MANLDARIEGKFQQDAGWKPQDNKRPNDHHAAVWIALLAAKERLAERQGFEPWIPVKVYTLSKRAPSATRPSLREGSWAASRLFYWITSCKTAPSLRSA